MNRVFTIVLVSVVLLVSLPLSAKTTPDITVEVSLSRDTIGLDEQAVLQIDVAGSEQDLPHPNMPTLAKFEVYSQGRSSNISIVNGQVSTSYTYRYILVPKEAGTFPIQNIAVVHKNHRYPGNAVELTVLNKGAAAPQELEDNATDVQGNSRDYFLEASIDKSNPYVNEQVTLTLKFYIAVQYYGTPELSAPQTTGFWTEVLGSRPPYFQKINDRNYRVLEIRYALFPTQTGDLTIGRATITTTVRTRQRRRSQHGLFDDFFGRGEEVQVRSRPIDVTVKPLPTAGRPPDFSGTIGNFSITAAADKRDVEVNEPVTLSVRISGTGNIKSVAAPEIPEQTDFRVYRASSNESLTKQNDRLGGTKTFEEVFIPKRPGDLVIPALEFTYFDPSAARYRRLSTKPINLTVKAGENYTESSEIPYGTPGVSISAEARDIRYIKEDLGEVSHSSGLILTSPLYLMVNGASVLVMLGLVVARVRRERMSNDVGYARARSASRMARKRLAEARKMADAARAKEFYGELHLAVTAYIGDKFNLSPHGLTHERIRELLSRSHDGDEVQGAVLHFLEKCDFARFAPATQSAEELADDLKSAEDLMVQMEDLKLA